MTPESACCELGAKLQDPRQVLYITDHFFVAPSLGPMGIEGYLLILSNQCFRGVGDIPETLHTELEDVTHTVRRVLREVYDVDSQMFEHGPRINGIRGGGCLDHAHLHVVPGVDFTDDLAVDLMRRLNPDQFYRVDQVQGIKGFQRIGEIFHAQKTSYLMAESSEGKRLVTEVNSPVPSQYLRRMIAKQRGIPDRWDWATDPQRDIVERTIDALQGRF